MEHKLLNIFTNGKNLLLKFILQMVRGDAIELENDVPTKHSGKKRSFSPEKQVEIQVILEEVLHRQITKETIHEST